jgi:hypothetical protein
MKVTEVKQKHLKGHLRCNFMRSVRNSSTLQNIIFSSKVGTGCNSRLPAYCVGSINYVIFYTFMFFHIIHLKVKLGSDRTTSLRYIRMLISMLVRQRNGLELDLVGNSLVICNRIE